VNERPSGRNWIALFSLALACVWGCEKGTSSAAPPSASASGAAAGSVAPTPAASAKAAMAGSDWTGSYAAKVGQVDPPPAAHEKTWTQDLGHAATGAGTIELAVAPSGAALGDAKGVLGELAVSGTFDGHELRANLIPKDPNAEGAMTGWMSLTAEGEPSAAKSLKGTMRVASRDAKLVREASVQLARK
jgi:hypothetical protein